MADSNRLRLGVIRESAGLGITDAINTAANGSTLRAVRTTADSVTYNKTTAATTEIRPDRNVVDLVSIGGQVGGTLGFEIHEPHPASDTVIFLESLMCSKWTLWGAATSGANIHVSDGSSLQMTVNANGTASLTTTLVAANNAYIAVRGCNDARDGVWQATGTSQGVISLNPVSNTTVTGAPSGAVPAGGAAILATVPVSGTLALSVNNGSGTLTASANMGIPVGTWLKLLQTDNNGANDGFYHVSGLGNGGAELFFDIVPSQATSGNITVGHLCYSYQFRNGTSLNSFSLSETLFSTQGAPFSTISKGIAVDQCAYSFNTTGIATGTYTFMGLTQSGAPGYGLGNPAPALTTRAMSSRANVSEISMGGSALGGLNSAKTLSLTVQNNLRAQPGIGSYGLVGIGQGNFSVTGSVSIYFQSLNSWQAFMNDQNVSLSAIIGIDGAYTAFTIPKLRQSANTHLARGPNQDVTADINFTGLYDAATNCTMQLDYFPYAG